MPSSPFLRDVPADEARAAWRLTCEAAGCPQRLPAVPLGLFEAVARVTAAPIWARRSSPAFDASAMDGIAVRAADTLGAGPSSPLVLPAGSFEIVDTGDPLPQRFDAVVMREDVHLVAGGSGTTAELRGAVPPYQHVRSIGEDVASGELLLPEGHRLRPVDVAAAGAAGASTLLVRRQPIVAIVPTGDEIRPLGQATGVGEIPDTNSLMLAAQAHQAGCRTLVSPIEPDDPERLVAALHTACAQADLVLVIAGSSAGRDDHTAAVLAAAGVVAVHGVAVKPGHPVVLGVVDRTPVIGVPGYPVSAALTFELFAAPLLSALEGAAPQRRPRVTARLARKLASTLGTDDWVRVRLGRVEDRIVATPLPRGAGVLTSLVRADGLLVVTAGLEGHHAGEDVEVELLRAIEEVERTIVVIGSHDLVLDVAASRLRSLDPLITLASSNVGSLGGLLALRDGLCHVAGSHLLDPATGIYTLPWLDRVLAGHDLAVIRLVDRDQGLIVQPGNPLSVTGIGDLTRPEVTYVNRQRGAGTRVLLDHELARRGLDPSAVAGYAREEHTHLAVAAAVAAGRADCGLGLLAAARAFGLDFVPVVREPYDLVLHTAALEDERLAPLFALLDDEEFKREAESLGGYSTRETGLRVR